MKDFIREQVKEYVRNCKENWFNITNDHYYDEPVVNFASADDDLFEDYKTIIGECHQTPKEVYEAAFGEGSYAGGTVISAVLPLNEKIRKSNRGQKNWPSKEWVLNRSYGDGILINKTAHFIVDMLEDKGYHAVAPYASEGFRVFPTETGPISNWSERHIAYVAGLGTFSLNDGFISEKGIAVRLISVVTNLILEPDHRKAQQHTQNCLYYSKGICGACIKRCPVGAITEKGHDKVKCRNYVYGEESSKLAVSYGGNAKAGSGCGLCQTNIPCEFRNPMSNIAIV